MIFSSAFVALMGVVLAFDRLQPRKQQKGVRVGGSESFDVALLLVILSHFATSGGKAALFGALFGLGYAGWMLWKLRLAVPVSVMLASSQTFVWTLFALGAWKLWGLPFPLNIALIACFGTAVFWLEWTLLPLWGTAQNFSCSSPKSPALIALVGTAGGTWVTLCYSALFAQFFPALILKSQMPSFIQALCWCLSFFIVLRGLDALLFRGKAATLRVATFGWSGNAFDALAEIPAEFQNAARKASEDGARLLVTPEAAIRVQDRAHFRVTICSLAQKYDLALAIGYFDNNENRNCIDFVSARGEIVGRYVKTHLVPVFERYTRGTGDIALMDVDGVKVGGLICQDDNFPDIARKYGRAGVQLLVVPTNDWKRVKDIHFANHLWRALEFRFALARAASDGISALTSANGQVEAVSDHFYNKSNLLVANVRVGTGKPTLYARTGDWFPVACGVVSIGAIIWSTFG